MFSGQYPITPSLWMKYLKIEKNLAVSHDEIVRVQELFRTALKDYYCKKQLVSVNMKYT